MRPDAEPDERVAALLRDRLRAADEEIGTPPGLWERVRAADAQPRRAAIGTRLRLGWAVAATAVLVCAVVLGAWWLVRPTADTPADGGRFTLSVTVFNAEGPCRPLRTMECALRLAKDPYAEYAAPDNTAGRVWHGDRLSAACVVTRGTLVTDESGVTSTRWYLVRTRDGAEGWLPGVRTRNTAEVRTCSESEVGNSR
ncbi:hypothetical protein G5C60_24220 [Streptomyces sp. HC44]|uniref:Uncharacterized protein n=1 Tax=Streptomyces scabichelini TaxID=2711217 RepID=A0A6G4V983_9ACTN|nr:hypothetical protein [Streptomyces scabichelini]NGO10616.1 hypothetical protein [Streptomyces scabichelini]